MSHPRHLLASVQILCCQPEERDQAVYYSKRLLCAGLAPNLIADDQQNQAQYAHRDDDAEERRIVPKLNAGRQKEDNEQIHHPDPQPKEHQAGAGFSFFLYVHHGHMSVRLVTHRVRGSARFHRLPQSFHIHPLGLPRHPQGTYDKPRRPTNRS